MKFRFTVNSLVWMKTPIINKNLYISNNIVQCKLRNPQITCFMICCCELFWLFGLCMIWQVTTMFIESSEIRKILRPILRHEWQKEASSSSESWILNDVSVLNIRSMRREAEETLIVETPDKSQMSGCRTVLSTTKLSWNSVVPFL